MSFLPQQTLLESGSELSGTRYLVLDFLLFPPYIVSMALTDCLVMLEATHHLFLVLLHFGRLGNGE